MKRYFSILLLPFALLALSLPVWSQTRTIAHRGYWKTTGSAQNSLASLAKADSVGAYGSEFDVWLTSDDELVVDHDRRFKGVDMPMATAEECTAVILDNGENLPTLERYLEAASGTKGLRLVLELKSIKDTPRDQKAIELILPLLDEYDVRDRIDFISFSLDACKIFHRMAPSIPVYYLNGELSPEEIKALGFAGMDYHYNVFKKNPDWMSKAHELGLKVNVWTVDDEALMRDLIGQGADFITTNRPDLLLEILKETPGEGSNSVRK